MGYSNTGTSPKIVVEYEHVWDSTKKHHGIWWDKVLSHTRFFCRSKCAKLPCGWYAMFQAAIMGD
jgi:hypothetical protein